MEPGPIKDPNFKALRRLFTEEDLIRYEEELFRKEQILIKREQEYRRKGDLAGRVISESPRPEGSPIPSPLHFVSSAKEFVKGPILLKDIKGTFQTKVPEQMLEHAIIPVAYFTGDPKLSSPNAKEVHIYNATKTAVKTESLAESIREKTIEKTEFRDPVKNDFSDIYSIWTLLYPSGHPSFFYHLICELESEQLNYDFSMMALNGLLGSTLIDDSVKNNITQILKKYHTKEKSKTFFESFFLFVYYLVDKHKREQALQICLLMNAYNSDSFLLKAIAADLYVKAGECQKAAEICEKLLTLLPNNSLVQIILLTANFHLSKFEETKSLCYKELLLNPDSFYLLSYLGASLMRLGQNELGLKRFQEALRLERYYPLALLLRALSASEIEHLLQAKEDLSKIVAKYPHSLYISNCFHEVLYKIEVINESRRCL